ncbi:MAG: T9SS type A sorting domain-containing protein, partial [Flavobacteriia bacterium]
DMITVDGEMYAGIVTCVAGEAKFRQDDAWAINWGAADFPAGVGVQDGPNIPVAAGTYLVLFNRTTGMYSFQTNFDVTYKVDVTNYLAANTLAANGIRVGGNFTDNGGSVAAGAVANWSPADANSAMTDEGNNIWSITVTYPVASLGATQFYKFVNGDWGANEGTDAANTIAVDSCGVDDGAGNINRTYTLLPGTVCYVWDACTACGVSVAENAIANLTVAPNPATDVVNFTFDANNAATATVTIFDLAGKAVATQTVATSATTTVEMNTTALQAGSYIYNVVAGDKVATGKLIKQ